MQFLIDNAQLSEPVLRVVASLMEVEFRPDSRRISPQILLNNLFFLAFDHACQPPVRWHGCRPGRCQIRPVDERSIEGQIAQVLSGNLLWLPLASQVHKRFDATIQLLV